MRLLQQSERSACFKSICEPGPDRVPSSTASLDDTVAEALKRAGTAFVGTDNNALVKRSLLLASFMESCAVRVAEGRCAADRLRPAARAAVSPVMETGQARRKKSSSHASRSRSCTVASTRTKRPMSGSCALAGSRSHHGSLSPVASIRNGRCTTIAERTGIFA